MLLLALLFVTAAKAEDIGTPLPPQRIDYFAGCVLSPDPLNDGDSFVVQFQDGGRATFRLYFVDAAEDHLSGKRSSRQARYFRIKPHRVAAIGRAATEFTARALAEPFTLFTRWHSNFDEGRYLAFVRTADDKDLAELLVRNGLAIPRGQRAHTPYGRSSRSHYRHLKSLERLAQKDQVGGWAGP